MRPISVVGVLRVVGVRGACPYNRSAPQSGADPVNRQDRYNRDPRWPIHLPTQPLHPRVFIDPVNRHNPQVAHIHTNSYR